MWWFNKKEKENQSKSANCKALEAKHTVWTSIHWFIYLTNIHCAILSHVFFWASGFSCKNTLNGCSHGLYSPQDWPLKHALWFIYLLSLLIIVYLLLTECKFHELIKFCVFLPGKNCPQSSAWNTVGFNKHLLWMNHGVHFLARDKT